MANYNGVDLPEVPADLLESYSYLYIAGYGTGTYCLYMSTAPLVVVKIGENYNLRTKEITSYVFHESTSGATSWTKKSTKTNASADKSLITTLAPTWANYDVYERDTNEIVISASPIPGGSNAAETPNITQNLPLFGKVTYEQGGMADTLTIAAEVSDGGTLTYQWYKNDVAIDGATEASYTPSVEVGPAVYYCVVTNTLGEVTATVQSESITIIGYAVFLSASEPIPVYV